VSIDLGKTQIDQQLLTELLSAGVRESDARELARVGVFGGLPAPTWIAGLKAATTLFIGGSIILDWGTLPSPWDATCSALANCNGTSTDTALLDSLQTYSPDVQAALISALGMVAANQSNKANRPHASANQNTRNQTRAVAAQQTATYLRPLDPDLIRRVQAALNQHGPKDQLRKKAGEILIDWLIDHGKFIMTPTNSAKYYLFRDERKLYNLDSDLWHAWLYRATGCNPASTDFRYLDADCQAAAYDGDRVEVCRVAHWDGQFLRVSQFNGSVFRLDGQTIETEANGDGPIIFYDDPAWSAYTPDLNSSGLSLNWWLELLNTDGKPIEARLTLRAWLLSLFFIELCPTQVLLLIRGEAGSGKSMTLRVLMRLLFGPVGQISGIPDKPDGFTASAANSHLLVLDNLDEPSHWLRDKLARITTGGIDHYRKLYTGNDLGTVMYRCWVAVTARTPDTLRRDDLADRLLMLSVARIQTQIPESIFLLDSLKKRNEWWGDVLQALNATVATIRRDGIPKQSSMRMADFEALGRITARADGQEAVWERAVKDWGSHQAQFLLEDSVITEALELWLSIPANRLRRLDTRTLFQECESALFGTNRPDRSWPRSARSFGKALAGLRRSLQSRFIVYWWESPSRTYYQFDVLPTP
jgi:hypothetical protein